MSATIFKHEFLTRLKSVIIWSLSITFLIVFFFSMFPVFADQAALMNEALSRYPAELRTALGLDKMDMATVLGFYSFIFLFVQLCLAIQASNYGFGLVSVEETDLTADFLMSKPVSRTQILNSKLLAAIASLSITNLVIWASTFIAIPLFSEGREYDSSILLLLLLSIFIFQLFFLSVGLVVSLMLKRIRSVTPFGLGLAFGAYVLNGFSGIFGDIKLEYITPFKHIEAAYIVIQKSYNMPLLLLNIGITILSIAASYWLYVHRDIKAVS